MLCRKYVFFGEKKAYLGDKVSYQGIIHFLGICTLSDITDDSNHITTTDQVYHTI